MRQTTQFVSLVSGTYQDASMESWQDLKKKSPLFRLLLFTFAVSRYKFEHVGGSQLVRGYDNHILMPPFCFKISLFLGV